MLRGLLLLRHVWITYVLLTTKQVFKINLCLFEKVCRTHPVMNCTVRQTLATSMVAPSEFNHPQDTIGRRYSIERRVQPPSFP